MFISAVVPVYNSVNTLERAINSLLIQPEINEIFVVDDGSTDGSYDLELELESKNPIIKVLIHPERKNKGASSSRNLGLMHCSNDWIQFLDADDELLLEKVNRQIDLIEGSTKLIVGNSFYEFNNTLKKVKSLSNPWIGLLMAKFGNTCSNLWKKSVINEVGLWDESLINTQEYDLMFRIIKFKGEVGFSNDFLTIIHRTKGSISFSPKNKIYKRDNLLLYRVSIKEYLEEIKSYNLLYKYYFSASVGTVLRYHDSKLTIEYSRLFYFIYKSIKSISDRVGVWLV